MSRYTAVNFDRVANPTATPPVQPGLLVRITGLPDEIGAEYVQAVLQNDFYLDRKVDETKIIVREVP